MKKKNVKENNLQGKHIEKEFDKEMKRRRKMGERKRGRMRESSTNRGLHKWFHFYG